MVVVQEEEDEEEEEEEEEEGKDWKMMVGEVVEKQTEVLASDAREGIVAKYSRMGNGNSFEVEMDYSINKVVVVEKVVGEG